MAEVGSGHSLLQVDTQSRSKTGKADGDSHGKEKRGPYIMSKLPALHIKLQKQRELAKKALKKKGMMSGTVMQHSKYEATKSVRFNRGYSPVSQSMEETLVCLDSDSDGEVESRYSSGYSSAEQVSQDLNRQLLKDGYRLDEIPDDEDLDLIPPKPVTSANCGCCCGETASCTIQ